jgi:hypothetical protein
MVKKLIFKAEVVKAKFAEIAVFVFRFGKSSTLLCGTSE